ncbi:hypothetical protein PVAP13_8NG277601 [Panicum virgatum]|uniref:Uncharacterized protein n=1 Tax=Panicum virgatum TaxID=38727 RepID=A0A8T0PCC3_PANVG|nr:hypothetical protein PVAP13_8NG277601 [Panicum virgatum]
MYDSRSPSRMASSSPRHQQCRRLACRLRPRARPSLAPAPSCGLIRTRRPRAVACSSPALSASSATLPLARARTDPWSSSAADLVGNHRSTVVAGVHGRRGGASR